MRNVGVICIVTGVYNRFWDGFYESVNKNFCVESHKNFYIFTDNAELVQSNLPENVFPTLIKDRGWVLNVMLRSDMFLSIENELRKNDFVFNLNSNYRAVAPIHDTELLPEESHGWLSGLCFDFYTQRDPDTFTYDRNPNTQAYIPYGEGKYYFQGGFYGGRTAEFLEMSRQIKAMTDIDIASKLIPRFHDESYVNRYLLDRNPKVIGTQYATAEQWNSSEDVKGILLDKDRWLSANDIENMKAIHAEPSLSFLVHENLESQPIGVVNLKGGLGNQMFQYAMILQLQKSFPNRRFYLNVETLPLLECHQGYQLDTVFGVSNDLIATRELLSQIDKVPQKYIKRIEEPLFCGYMPIENSTHPIWILNGYWQSEKYFDQNRLQLDYNILNNESLNILAYIQNTKKSIAIHVRRGDYVRDIKTYNLMGEICTKEYYHQAVKQFDIDSRFFVFSDDITWCQRWLNLPRNTVYVAHNQGVDSWQDMVLMSACGHQIIANSSFSWWAAWLNNNPKKVVITPSKWFNGIEDRELIPSSWRRIEPELPQKRYDDLTIVIPIRIDSEERLRNLEFLLNDFQKYYGLKVIVLEADIVSRLGEYEVYSYDGRFYNVYGEVMQEFLDSKDERVLLENQNKHYLVYGYHSCGGAFMVNREAYVAVGGENELFKAWGVEDLERFKRWEISGYNIARIDGAIYHLYHPIGINSRYNNIEAKRQSSKVLLDTCKGT